MITGVIFKRVGDGRPYPDHGLDPRGWAALPPRQVRLDELVTTKDTLQLAALLDEDSTFYGDLFAHVVRVAGATSTSRTACTAPCAPRSSSATSCTRASTRRPTNDAVPLGTALTLAGLAVLVLACRGAGAGPALTEPFPAGRRRSRSASDATVPPGEQVRRRQVTVSVFNGGTRSGLAGTTAAQLDRARLRAGHRGNAPLGAAATAPDLDHRAGQPGGRCSCSGSSSARRSSSATSSVPASSSSSATKFQSLAKKQVESVVAEADATWCKATGSSDDRPAGPA